MRFLLLFLSVLSISSVWADAPASTPPKEPVDIRPILVNIKNPFESKLPLPPMPQVVQQMGQAVMNQAGTAVNNFQSAIQPAEPVIQKPNLTIEGTVWSDTIHQAIVNKQVVAVGDEINGVKIKQINRDGVKVVYKGKKFVYTID